MQDLKSNFDSLIATFNAASAAVAEFSRTYDRWALDIYLHDHPTRSRPGGRAGTRRLRKKFRRTIYTELSRKFILDARREARARRIRDILKSPAELAAEFNAQKQLRIDEMTRRLAEFEARATRLPDGTLVDLTENVGVTVTEEAPHSH